MSLPVILFAAGRSTRMGKSSRLGNSKVPGKDGMPAKTGPSATSRLPERNKLLMDVGGEPLARKTAALYLRSRAEKVYVVVGHRSDEVRKVLAGLDLAFVHNSRFASGKSTSIVLGILALPESTPGVMFAQADMPFVLVETIDFLLSYFQPGHGAIVVPTFRGKMGSPKIFDQRYFPELLALTGESTGSSLFSEHSADLHYVEVQDEGVVLDIDEDADLRPVLGETNR